MTIQKSLFAAALCLFAAAPATGQTNTVAPNGAGAVRGELPVSRQGVPHIQRKLSPRPRRRDFGSRQGSAGLFVGEDESFADRVDLSRVGWRGQRSGADDHPTD